MTPDIEKLTETIRIAVLSCGHTITAEEIVLRQSDKRSGNALNQLSQRISEALSRSLSSEERQ